MNQLAAVNIGEKFGSSFGGEQKQGFADLVSLILSNALVIAGLILLFILVLGGISIIIGAGQNNPEKAAKGRQAATSAVIGFGVIFVVYWLMRIIETITGLDILAPTL